MQLKHAAITLDNMRAMQTQTVTYRHDMRHHFSYLQALAATGDLEKIQNYIHTIQSDIDDITPQRFCQNELVNLILSTYDTKAVKKQITLNIQAPIPKDLPISDTKLCAILSNALENALQATEKSGNKTIEVRLAIHNSALLIQINNPFAGTVAYNNQIPSASQSNHGFGTKSIAAIVDAYHGQYEFMAENQVFTVRVLLPLNSN
ncbi:MAG: sensor histidine kinase [Lachnospiraceae bacterium]|nr:sensor histidine kinase [Lachnospiraceae bacterium]